jgi:hypothetical protein
MPGLSGLPTGLSSRGGEGEGGGRPVDSYRVGKRPPPGRQVLVQQAAKLVQDNRWAVGGRGEGGVEEEGFLRGIGMGIAYD